MAAQLVASREVLSSTKLVIKEGESVARTNLRIYSLIFNGKKFVLKQ
jgi:hypothetical protein